jgi:hypothetical protein
MILFPLTTTWIFRPLRRHGFYALAVPSRTQRDADVFLLPLPSII